MRLAAADASPYTESMRNLAALVLAAGSSRRLGSPKQLLDWGGRPLLDVVVDEVKQWPVSDVYVVLGARAEEILDQCALAGVTVVINDDFEEGIASSIRVGLDTLMRDSNFDGVFFALGDQPAVDLEVVESMVSAFETTSAKAIVPKYRYNRGNPVLVSESLWPRLMSLEGDIGAHKLLEAHPEWVEEMWVEKLAPRDVDTPADVAELSPRSTR